MSVFGEANREADNAQNERNEHRILNKMNFDEENTHDGSKEYDLCDFTFSSESEKILRCLYKECSRTMSVAASIDANFSLLYDADRLRYCEYVYESINRGQTSSAVCMMDQNAADKDNILQNLEDNPKELKRRYVAIAKAKMCDSYKVMVVLFPDRSRFNDAPRTPEKFRKSSRRVCDTNFRKWKRSIYSFIEHHVSPELCAKARSYVKQQWEKLENEEISINDSQSTNKEANDTKCNEFSANGDKTKFETLSWDELGD